MEVLKKEMLSFAQSLSGIPPCKEEEPKELLPVDYKPMLYAPYVAGWQNDWVMEVYESVVQLVRELNEENTYLIEQRFNRIKRKYHDLKNKPRKITSGLNSQYERAYSNKYYF